MMASCQLGVFEYQFVYIQWTATSLGAIVGVLGGLFVGMLLLGVAVVVHQLYLAKKQSNTSLKDQVREAACISSSQQGVLGVVFWNIREAYSLCYSIHMNRQVHP